MKLIRYPRGKLYSPWDTSIKIRSGIAVTLWTGNTHMVNHMYGNTRGINVQFIAWNSLLKDFIDFLSMYNLQ